MTIKGEPNTVMLKVSLPSRTMTGLLRMQREGGHRTVAAVARSILMTVVDEDAAAHGEPVSHETGQGSPQAPYQAGGE